MITLAIATYLKEQGIKQTVISEKTGLTKQIICSALKGKRTLSVDEYEKICRALNVPYDFFFKNLKTA